MRLSKKGGFSATLILITLLFTASLAVRPVEHEKCATHCQRIQSDDSKFNYEQGSTYKYSYHTVSSTFVNGTSDDKSQLAISATVELYIATPCEFVLQLQNVKLEESSPGGETLVVAKHNSEFKSALERHPLRFEFNDGKITELCPDVSDIPLSLNVKRGVLSTFQNSMKSLYSDATLYEKDVTGVCKTHYKVESIEWYKFSIKKTKNLLNCGGHVQESPASLFLPSALQKTSQANTQPLVRSEQECTQTAKHSGIISSASCHETHLFRPFSNTKNGRSSGVVTEIHQSLSLVSISPLSVPPKTDNEVKKRTSLLYDHIKQEHESTIATEDNVYETLNLLHENSINGVNNKFLKLFSTLVSQIKTLGYPQLTKIFSKFDKGSSMRKFLLDTMPLVGTADSMTVMRDLFKENEISSDEMDRWLTSLAFQRAPTIEMISAMKPLLDDGFHAKAMLGISSLIYSYCTTGNDRNCSTENEVLEVMKRFEEYIGDHCEAGTRVYKEAVVVALKSIGNAGVLRNVNDKLKNCYQTRSNPMDVRLAAISSLRRAPCDSNYRASMLDLYTNIEEDTELRIAGYLTAMQCPSTSVISLVKETLYNDEVNQVASFVWTHLTNLQETSSSWKKEIKDMLQSEYLQNKFKTDVIKFSRNYEGTIFNDDLNAGATIESNVIFSPESYLPRSAAVNITIDLFGETLNIFELGTRLEGFEQIIEDLFGENGYFKDDSALKILQNLMQFKPEKKANPDLSNNYVNNDIIEFSSDFKENNRLGKKPQGSFYGRVFGNELYLKQFDGLNGLFDYSNRNNNEHPSGNVLDFLKNVLINKNVDYTKSIELINTKYIISTMSGLPLEISINGSTTVGLKLNSQSNFTDLFKTLSASMELSVNPSAAVEITGVMSVDASVTKTGIKSVSKLNTNTKNEFKISMENGNIVELLVGIPNDKMEIIDVSSKVFVLHQNEPIAIKGIDNIESWDTCSGERIPTKTGVQLCSRFMFSNATSLNAPYFPLSGPFHYALSIEKTDSFSNYFFKFERREDMGVNKLIRSMFIKFDTPGSKLNRKIELYGSLDYVKNSIKLSLDTPMSGSYNALLNCDNTSTKKGLSFSLNHNDEEMINVTSALLMSSSQRSGWYQPSLTINIYKKLYLDVNGNINYDHGSKYSSNLVISGITENPFTLAGDVYLNKGKYNALIKVQSPLIDIKATGYLKHSVTSLSAKTKLLYSLPSDERLHNIDFSGKLHRHGRGSLLKDKAHLNLQMSAWPQYNTALLWELHRSNNYFNSRSRLNIGETKWVTRQLFTNIVSKKNNHRDFAVKLSLACPNKGLDYKAEIQHKVNESDILSYVLGQVNDKNKFMGKFNYKINSGLHQQVEVELVDPWKGISLNGELNLSKNDVILGYGSVAYGEHSKQKILNVLFNHTASKSESSLKYVLHSIVSESYAGEEFHTLVHANASYYTVFENEMNKSNVFAYINYKEDIYLIDLDYATDLLSHLVSLKLSRPGSDLAAKLEVKNSLYNKKLSLDVKSLRNFSFNIWALNENSEMEYYYNSDNNLDVDLPSYYNKAGLSFYWDKDHDDSRSIILDIKSNQFNKIAELTVPGQYYLFNFDVLESAMETNLSWGVNKNAIDKHIMLRLDWQIQLPSVASSVILTTPFEGFEKQKFAFDFNMTESDVMLISNIDWQASQTELKLIWNLQKDWFNGLTTVKSTLPSIKELTIQLNGTRNYEDNGHKIVHRSAFIFNYNEDKTHFSSNFVKENNRNYHGSISSGSSYYSGNEILGYFNLDSDKKEFKFNTTWAKDKIVSLSCGSKSPGSYYLRMDTPISYIQKVNIDSLISSMNNNLQFKIDIDINNNLANLLFLNVYKKNTLINSLSVSSTYPEIELLLNNTITNGNGGITFENKFIINSNEINYLLWETKGNFINFPEKFSLDSVFNVPLHNFVINLSHDTKKNNVNEIGNDHYELQSIFNAYYDEIYGIDMRFHYNEDATYKNINFYLITAGFHESNNNIVFDFKHKQEKGVFYKTLLILPYDYIIKHHLNFKYDSFNDKKIMGNLFEVNLGEDHISLCKVHHLYNYNILHNNMHNYENEVEIVLNDNKKSFIKFNIILDQLNSLLHQAELSLTSPWVDPVSVTYNLEDNPSSSSSKDVKILINYNKNKKISVHSSIFYSPLMKNITIEIESPFCKNILFKSFNDFTNDVKVSKNSLKYNENKETLLEFQIKQDILNPLFYINLKNSDNVNFFFVNTTYDLLSENRKNVYFKTDFSDYKILFSTNYINEKLFTHQIYNTSVILITNLKEWENFTSSFELIKDLKTYLPKKINLLVSKNSDNLEFNASHSFTDFNHPIHFDINYITNENYHIFNAHYLDKQSNNLNNLLKLKYNENGRVVKIDGGLNADDVNKQYFEFEVKTPYNGYESFVGKIGLPVHDKNKQSTEVTALLLYKEEEVLKFFLTKKDISENTYEVDFKLTSILNDNSITYSGHIKRTKQEQCFGELLLYFYKNYHESVHINLVSSKKSDYSTTFLLKGHLNDKSFATINFERNYNVVQTFEIYFKNFILNDTELKITRQVDTDLEINNGQTNVPFSFYVKYYDRTVAFFIVKIDHLNTATLSITEFLNIKNITMYADFFKDENLKGNFYFMTDNVTKLNTSVIVNESNINLELFTPIRNLNRITISVNGSVDEVNEKFVFMNIIKYKNDLITPQEKYDINMKYVQDLSVNVLIDLPLSSGETYQLGLNYKNLTDTDFSKYVDIYATKSREVIFQVSGNFYSKKHNWNENVEADIKFFVKNWKDIKIGFEVINELNMKSLLGNFKIDNSYVILHTNYKSKYLNFSSVINYEKIYRQFEFSSDYSRSEKLIYSIFKSDNDYKLFEFKTRYKLIDDLSFSTFLVINSHNVFDLDILAKTLFDIKTYLSVNYIYNEYDFVYIFDVDYDFTNDKKVGKLMINIGGDKEYNIDGELLLTDEVSNSGFCNLFLSTTSMKKLNTFLLKSEYNFGTVDDTSKGLNFMIGIDNLEYLNFILTSANLKKSFFYVLLPPLLQSNYVESLSGRYNFNEDKKAAFLSISGDQPLKLDMEYEMNDVYGGIQMTMFVGSEERNHHINITYDIKSEIDLNVELIFDSEHIIDFKLSYDGLQEGSLSINHPFYDDKFGLLFSYDFVDATKKIIGKLNCDSKQYEFHNSLLFLKSVIVVDVTSKIPKHSFVIHGTYGSKVTEDNSGLVFNVYYNDLKKFDLLFYISELNINDIRSIEFNLYSPFVAIQIKSSYKVFRMYNIFISTSYLKANKNTTNHFESTIECKTDDFCKSGQGFFIASGSSFSSPISLKLNHDLSRKLSKLNLTSETGEKTYNLYGQYSSGNGFLTNENMVLFLREVKGNSSLFSVNGEIIRNNDSKKSVGKLTVQYPIQKTIKTVELSFESSIGFLFPFYNTGSDDSKDFCESLSTDKLFDLKLTSFTDNKTDLNETVKMIYDCEKKGTNIFIDLPNFSFSDVIIFTKFNSSYANLNVFVQESNFITSYLSWNLSDQNLFIDSLTDIKKSNLHYLKYVEGITVLKMRFNDRHENNVLIFESPLNFIEKLHYIYKRNSLNLYLHCRTNNIDNSFNVSFVNHSNGNYAFTSGITFKDLTLFILDYHFNNQNQSMRYGKLEKLKFYVAENEFVEINGGWTIRDKGIGMGKVDGFIVAEGKSNSNSKENKLKKTFAMYLDSTYEISEESIKNVSVSVDTKLNSESFLLIETGYNHESESLTDENIHHLFIKVYPDTKNRLKNYTILSSIQSDNQKNIGGDLYFNSIDSVFDLIFSFTSDNMNCNLMLLSPNNIKKYQFGYSKQLKCIDEECFTPSDELLLYINNNTMTISYAYNDISYDSKINFTLSDFINLIGYVEFKGIISPYYEHSITYEVNGKKCNLYFKSSSEENVINNLLYIEAEKLIKFEFNIDSNYLNPFIEVKYSHDSKNKIWNDLTYYIRVTYENEDDLMNKYICFIRSPYTDDKTVSIIYNKLSSYDNVFLDINVDQISVLTLQKDDTSGSLYINLNGKEHLLYYELKSAIGGTYEVNAEAKLFSLIMSGVFYKFQDGIKFYIEYFDKSRISLKNQFILEIRESRVFASGDMYYPLFKYELKFDGVYTPSDKYSFVIDLYNNESNITGMVNWGKNYINNTFLLKFNKKWPVHFEFNFINPDKTLKSLLIFNNTHIVSFIGNSDESLNEFVSLEVAGVINETSAEWFFKLRSPFLEEIKLINSNLIVDRSDSSETYVFNLYYVSGNDNEFKGIKSKAFLNESIYLSADIFIRTPIKNYEKFDLSAGFKKDINSYIHNFIKTKFPNGNNYGIAFDLSINKNNVDEQIILLPTFYCWNKTTDIVGEIDFTNKHNDNVFECKHSLMISLKRTANDDGWSYLFNLNWNENKVLNMITSYSINLNDESAYLKYSLETIMKGHEKYGFELKVENNERKLLGLVINIPYFNNNDFVFYVFFTYKNLSNHELRMLLNVPHYQVLQNIKLDMNNRIDIRNNDVFSVFNVTCYKKFSVGYRVSFSLVNDVLNTDLLFQLDNKMFGIKLLNEKNTKSENVFVNILTPFSSFKQGKISILLFKNLYDGSKFVTEFNNVELLSVDFIKNENNINILEVKQNKRFLIIEHYYDFKYSYHLYGKIGWKNSGSKSICYIQSDINISMAEKSSILFQTVLPTIDQYTSLEFSFYNGQSEGIEYFGKLSLNKDADFGLRLRSKNYVEKNMSDNEIMFILPSKLIIINGRNAISDDIYNKYISIGWGKSENIIKKIGGEYVVENFDNGLTKRKLIFNHFSYTNDVQFELSTDEDNIKLEVSNSPEELDKFVAEVKKISNKDSVGSFEDPSSTLSSIEFSVMYPRSNIVYRFLTTYMLSSKTCKLGLMFEYLNNDNIYKYLSTFGKINYENKSINLIVDANKNKLSCGGSFWSKNNNFKGLTIETGINYREPLKLEIGFNDDNPELEMEFDYGLVKSYHLYAGIPNDRLLKAEISHSLYGAQIDDFISRVQLNSSRMLWASIKYSPQIYDNFMDTVGHESDIYGNIINNIINSFYEVMSDEEILIKPYTFYNELLNSVGLMIDDTFVEFEHVLTYFDDLYLLLEKIFNENQFYMKDIYKFFKSGILYSGEKVIFCVQKVAGAIQTVLESFVKIFDYVLKTLHLDKLKIKQVGISFKKNLQKFIESGREMLLSVNSLKSELITKFKTSVEEIRSNFHLLEKELFLKYYSFDMYLQNIYATSLYHYRVQMSQLHGFVNRMIVFIGVVEDSVFEIIKSINESLLTINELKSFVELCGEYSDWLKEVKLNSYVDKLKIFMEEVMKLVADDVHKNFEEYKSYLNTVSDIVIGNYDTIARSPIGNYIREVFNRIYYKMKWFWHYSEMTDRLKNSIHQLFVDIDKILERFINNIDKTMSTNKNDLSSSVVISSDRTYFELTQELPVNWNSFYTLPEIEQLPVYTDSVTTANDTAALEKYKYYLYDAVAYYTGNDISLKSIVPEFGASAMIGGNHYITFDGVIYDFDSNSSNNCSSYILAGDLIDNKFTIAINYINKGFGEHVKKSLIVLTEGHQISFDFKSKLTINGKQTEMPKSIGNTLVIHRDLNNIILDSKHGFKIDCNIKYDVCTVKLSGWYFGKTGGLLGTYNNEPVDDFSFANGSITQSIEKFTSSWLVNFDNLCDYDIRNNNKNVILNEQLNVGGYRYVENIKINDNSICKDYFHNRSSIFTPCFHVVNPEPYLYTCNIDMNSATVDTDVFIILCTNAALYVGQCNTAGVKLPMPPVCDRCNSMTSSSALQLGGTYYYNMDSPPPLSSDIVFIVELAPCVNKIKLSDIIAKLDSALSYNGIKNNRYAIITYGSIDSNSQFKDNIPYINTVDGNIWTSEIKSIEKTFKRGLYSSTNSVMSSDKPYDKGTDENYPPAYKALEYAASLRFRPGVSKTMVLIQCEKCSKNFVDHSYMNMIQTMLDNDITLHVLQQDAIESLNGKSSKIFGVDINGAYTGRNIKSLSPSGPLLKQVTLPKDLCSPVALETNGTLFSLDRISKKFMDVWVRRIAQTATPSSCQECTCVRMKDDSSNLICRICHVPSTEEVVMEWDNVAVDVNDGDYSTPIEVDGVVDIDEYEIDE